MFIIDDTRKGMILNDGVLRLGRALRAFENFAFTTRSVEGRARLQRFVYLLEAHGVRMGYDYSWYSRGPRCTKLLSDGFSLDSQYDMIQKDENQFESDEEREGFGKFAEFVNGREDDDVFLEVAASIHFLVMTGMRKPEEAVDEVLRNIKFYAEDNHIEVPEDFNREYVRRILCEIMDAGLIDEDSIPDNGWRPRITLSSTSRPQPISISELPSGMGTRHHDKSVYYLMHDAYILDGELELVGTNPFGSKPSLSESR